MTRILCHLFVRLSITHH